jgi:hypothetical protein
LKVTEERGISGIETMLRTLYKVGYIVARSEIGAINSLFK